MARAVVLAALLGLLVVAETAAAADPRVLQGTLDIEYKLEPVVDAQARHRVSGFVTHYGRYELRGRRTRVPGVPPRSYALEGAGEEFVVAAVTMSGASAGGTTDFAFTARAEGVVRLLRRPRGPRQTSGLLLTLLDGGRFRLHLSPLDAGEPGVPLDYKLTRTDTQPCPEGGGTESGRWDYERGVLTTTELQRCPNSEPSQNRTQGRSDSHTLWGANVWSSHADPHPEDLCRLENGPQPLTLCGRVRRDGRLRADVGLRGILSVGRCPFQPWGPGGLPDDPEDAVGTACMTVPPETVDWVGSLELKLRLRRAR